MPLVIFTGDELTRLRAQANKGVAVIVTGPHQYRITRDAIPPIAAAPDTQYVALSTVFAHPEDLLGATDLDAAADRLRDLATATPEYHQDLLNIARSAAALDTEHFELLIQAVYFSDVARMRMERTLAALVRRTDPTSLQLRTAIQANLALARSLAPYGNRILAAGLARASDLTADIGLNLLRRIDPAPGAGDAFGAFMARFGALNPAQELELIDLAKRKNEYAVAADVAGQWFVASSDGSAHSLAQLTEGFPSGAPLDGLIAGAAPRIRFALADDVRTLVHALDSDDTIRTAAPVLIAQIPELDAELLLQIVEALAAGSARDSVVQNSVQRISSVTPAEIRSVTSILYLPQAMRETARVLFGKLGQPVDAPTLISVGARFYTGQMRDEAMAGGMLAMPAGASLASTRVAELLSMASTARAQLDLLTLALPRISDLTVANSLVIATAIEAGASRDAGISALIVKVTDLTEAGIQQILSRVSIAADTAEILRLGNQRLHDTQAH